MLTITTGHFNLNYKGPKLVVDGNKTSSSAIIESISKDNFNLAEKIIETPN